MLACRSELTALTEILRRLVGDLGPILVGLLNVSGHVRLPRFLVDLVVIQIQFATNDLLKKRVAFELGADGHTIGARQNQGSHVAVIWSV